MNTISVTLIHHVFNTEYKPFINPFIKSHPYTMQFNTWVNSKYGFYLIGGGINDYTINVTNQHKKLLFDLKYIS